MASGSFLARLGYRPYPWLLLLASLCLTAYTGYLAHRQVALESQQRFAVIAGEVKTRIEDRINAYAQVLRGAQGLFAASGTVSRDLWHRYVNSLDLQRGFPGIQGVGFVRYLKPEHVSAHEREVRNEGYAHYRVWPQGPREEYSSIVYLEPFNEGNLRTLGYDMLSEPVRGQALIASRDSGQITATGVVTQGQEADRDVQPGFLIYLPVYRTTAAIDTLEQRRDALIGWVYAPIRMHDLMDGILGGVQQRVHLHVYDGFKANAAGLLYDNQPEEGVLGVEAGVWLQHRIDVAGRPWIIRFGAQPTFQAGESLRALPALVTAGGVLVSLLLFAVAKSLVRTQLRARAIAAELTQSLRQSRELHHRIVTLAHEGILAIDTRYKITYVNPRLAQMLAYEADDLLGRPVLDLVEPDHHAIVLRKLENRKRGVSESYEVDLLASSGARIAALLSAAPLVDDGGAFLGSFAMIIDNSARKQAREALQESESRFRSLANSASDAIISIDADGKVVSWNRAATRIFGYSEADMLGDPVSRVMPAKLAAQHQAYVSGYLQRGVPRVMGRTVELQGSRRTGESFPLELSLSEWSLEGRRYFTAIIRDITQRVNDAEALKQSEARLRCAILSAPVPMALHSEDGAIVILSDAWQRLSGYGVDEVPTMAAWLDKVQGQSLADGETGPSPGLPSAEGEFQILTRDGQSLIWDFHSSPLGAVADGRRLLITTAMDVTERRASEARVSYLAHHDTLTQLPNRSLLQERVERALSLARRKQGRLALIYFDIDHFKSVNDRMGHDVGDALLAAAAQRLRQCVRESDTMGRMGGDEFLSLLPEISARYQAAAVAEKIRAALAEPFDLQGTRVQVSSSIGIALYPEHGSDFQSLLKCADVAMYLAKSSGRDRYCFAVPVNDARRTERPSQSA